MLDKQTEAMLNVANSLTANDLDFIRGDSPERQVVSTAPRVMEQPVQVSQVVSTADAAPNSGPMPFAGERERMRTRESKIATACVGNERQRHEWWPIGTELSATIGTDLFTARVVENQRVKSGRGVLITSGAAQGTLCNTPTRAALEATEAYRQTNGLGRAGGVTNGWSFWKPDPQT